MFSWIVKKINRLKQKPEPYDDPRANISQAGPIGIPRTVDFFGTEEMDGADPLLKFYTKTQIENHIPLPQLKPISPRDYKSVLSEQESNNMYKALTAARRKNIVYETRFLYANPMQNLDYRIYETVQKHTIVGALADATVKYLTGQGFKPELELINPDKDNKKNQKEIENNQEIITKLLKIDNQLEQHDDDSIDVNFQQKISACIMSMLMYNRGALIFNYEKPIEVDGVSYPQIPSHMIYAHARDLTLIEIDPMTKRLKGVQWKHSSTFVPVRDMIYLWNPVTSAKIHNSWYYGISILSPLISSSKLIRKLLAEDFPAMAETSWAGLALIVAKNEGNTVESKRQEFSELQSGLGKGQLNVLVKDPKEVDVHNINYQPKIEEFRNLFESLIKLCISVMGLPQVGFYDEAAANRDTMIGKIQLTMKTNIEPMRKWIGDMIAQQWYMRWFRLLYKDKPEILEKFRIKLSWTDLHVTEWFDNIEAVMTLDGRQQLKNSEIGELLDLDNYESMVDPDAEVNAGGNPTGMEMQDGKGNSMNVSMKKNKKQTRPMGSASKK